MSTEHEMIPSATTTATATASETMPHDPMVTVRLSEPEPPVLAIATATPLPHDEDEEEDRRRSIVKDIEVEVVGPSSTKTTDPLNTNNEAKSDSDGSSTRSHSVDSKRDSASSLSDAEDINWEELQKTEEQEPESSKSDASTALLLARLDQENNLLVTNPKSGLTKTSTEPTPRATRPPSIQQLRRMVTAPTPSALRYSVIPPPPMTDLEFYAALVKDYTRTAQCLPTLLTKKIRSGIPPPLRGVVWQSMSGARDKALEEEYDRLLGETSPYEGIIGKDLGRSFPGVEMFRDPEGDGQQMLGRVLKCFSLHDKQIGYCQGLGFLVGPLLMHMGDKEAFCVLVRLMEHYDLRACFLPSLSGLHVRIHQFRHLLHDNLPLLAAHLSSLQIEPAYVSQWFLSFFAVTCPLPMLFRIFDVIFAEGASETIMRVALALMRKNEPKLMACTEFEDAMQLLLSRGLWDCYNYNADEFVNDFVGLSDTVTYEGLQALQASYRESAALDASEAIPSDLGNAASRFLGRLWASKGSVSAASASANSLSPAGTMMRPTASLQRSASKQSLTSTLNSVDVDSIMGCGSTTDGHGNGSRESSNTDNSSLRTPSASFQPSKEKNLHSQIEDLLTALSELQRNHAILATELQREREEREEDHNSVRSLLDALRKRADLTVEMETVEETVEEEVVEVEREEHGPQHPDSDVSPLTTEVTTPTPSAADLNVLLVTVENRFSTLLCARRTSTSGHTRAQLRTSLAQVKEALLLSNHRSQEFTVKIAEQEQQLHNLREEVKEGHGLIRRGNVEVRRLERVVAELRSSSRDARLEEEGGGKMGGGSSGRGSGSGGSGSGGSGSGSGGNGLRELKLGRQGSSGSSAPKPILSLGVKKRTSSSLAFSSSTSSSSTSTPTTTPTTTTTSEPTPPSSLETSPVVVVGGVSKSEHESLVLELIQCKTAVVLARQEAEEARGRVESMRRLLAVASAGPSIAMESSVLSSASASASASSTSTSTSTFVSPPPASASAGHKPSASQTSMLGGMGGSIGGALSTGFGWGGWGKRAAAAASAVEGSLATPSPAPVR